METMKKFSILLLTLGTLSLYASKKIIVDLSQQVAFAYENDQVQFYGRISTGKPGRRTPTGNFKVLGKDIDHVSNLWPAPNGGAKMHYMLRLTRDGIAMHLGPVPNYPASHGCIRMQNGFAQKMYFWAQRGISVTVKGTPPAKSPTFTLPSYSSKIERKLYAQATTREIASEASRVKPTVLALLSERGVKTTQQTSQTTPIVTSQPIAQKKLPKHHSQSATLPAPTPPASKPKITLNEALKKRGITSHPLAAISSNRKVKKLVEEAKKEVPKVHRKSPRVNPLKVLSGR
jgi:lipoprotein-anchoring transpeptidase ErfK/SrfK